MTATWTANHTWAVGEVATAANFNIYLRDNLDWLKTPTAQKVTTGFINSTSATYVDVTNMTTTVTTNGGGVDVLIRCTLGQSGAATNVLQLMVDGVSECILGTWVSPAGASYIPVSFVHHIGAMSAGSHTIKVQVKTNSGSILVVQTGTAVGDSLIYIREGGA